MILKDKVAVVTGGSSGIGAATVRMLADEGASVVICYNKGLERARVLLDELPKAENRIQHLAVEDSSSVRRAATEIGNAYGRADILVNSAGVTRPPAYAARRARRCFARCYPDCERARAVRHDPRLCAAAAKGGRRRERVVDLGLYRLRQQYRLLRVQGRAR